jgi:hypothetical protein
MCAIAGCGPKISPTVSMERQQRYGRLAIVCAPKQGANPAYGPLILNQCEKMISHLEFLERGDCLPDVWLDTASTPPVVDLNDVSGYDAVVALVYSYESGRVYLDFHMMDMATGEQIWYHQFVTRDPAIKDVLLAHGRSVPATIKKLFYGL